MDARPARAHPRTVLLGAMLFIAVGLGLYAIAPWVLPVRIIEGPLIQQATENAVTLIWYTTRPLAAGDCQVTVTGGPEDRTVSAETDGARNRVRIDGLAAGQAYPYRIDLKHRTLAEATLHANRAAGEPFSFIVFGDSGRGTPQQYRLAQRMQDYPADFILHVGDLIYSRGKRSKYKSRFFVPYRHLLAEVNFWPTLGNHELANFDIVQPDNSQPYFRVFELPENGPPALPPERNYWFDYAAARVVVIDSNELTEATLEKHVAPWLARVLTDCAPAWKFVSFHHPPYTAGSYEPNLDVQRTLVPVFEATGVDIVFSGHDHMYQRTHPMRGGKVVSDRAGVLYVVSGAGGAGLYDALPAEERPPHFAALNNQRHSFTHVQVTGDTLQLRQIDLDGNIIDEWTKTKTPPAPASQPSTSNVGSTHPSGEEP